ncbi:MAG: hypothetical protein N2Z69_08895 [Methylophilaceae bacterium]|nr:hypothetical protein [Methylophilaceae bacterium]
MSQLWDAKSAITGTAKGVRTAYQALDRADALLGQMAELVGMVKNYPPFPPGNEERVQYLNSIDGLRKMLQAVVVPPVEDQYQPVFYPRETKFPELDAKVPSDAAVLAFGEVVAALQGEVRMARQMLDAQAAQLYEQRAGNSPVPEEAQVPGLSATVATQLANVAWPIAGESNALAQLGG